MFETRKFCFLTIDLCVYVTHACCRRRQELSGARSGNDCHRVNHCYAAERVCVFIRKRSLACVVVNTVFVWWTCWLHHRGDGCAYISQSMSLHPTSVVVITVFVFSTGTELCYYCVVTFTLPPHPLWLIVLLLFVHTQVTSLSSSKHQLWSLTTAYGSILQCVDMCRRMNEDINYL